MDYRILKLNLISAKGLKKAPKLTCKMGIYAVVSISGTTEKQKTGLDKTGDSDATWNFPMKFVIEEAARLQNQLTLVAKIKAVGLIGGKTLGKVHVPVKELLDGVKRDGYEVITLSGKPKGVLSFSYKFGGKFTLRPKKKVPVSRTSSSDMGFGDGLMGGMVLGGIMSDADGCCYVG